MRAKMPSDMSVSRRDRCAGAGRVAVIEPVAALQRVPGDQADEMRGRQTR